ncbi:hybrid sensor histidine kinase/response regulator [Alphaproteobacteria bacterium endosymbiont of Tiliacea citrago]|uniref:hybrid sensor histidine kinase/response regulator n=1 Tax=Alphaproteobacteria bacterium endosymbiont of Tiliacea citrago TaxID=3077944 RepID=UPI00313F3253
MNIKLLLFFLVSITIMLFYVFFNKNKKKELFIELFEDNNQPAFIINNKSKAIVWFNKNFNIHFPEILKHDSINKLNPTFLLKHIKISRKKNEWIATNTQLDEETGVTLSPSNKADFKWWLDLPFPIAILTSNFEIEDENDHFKELIHKSQYKNNINELKNLMEISKHNKNHEIILYSAEGVYPSKIWITPYKTKFIIFIENRIEYIKLKNKAQESQHLQILGQLTSSIIHDFNNLLTCICGYTELLEEKLPQDENLEQINENVKQAKNLSEELLNFIREKPIEKSQIEPKVQIKKMENMFRKILGSKIQLEITANTNGSIRLSETQLERILLNMVINSQDAMPKGGFFKITTNEILLSTRLKTENEKTLSPGKYYVIDITDSGPGIPPNLIKKIFHPFFTTKLKGTGLGLSSCLKIIEHAGGTIKVTTSNKGTSFSILIPLIEKETSKLNLKDIEKDAEKNNKEQESNQEKKTIILVEDEEPIRNLVKKALESKYIVHGYSDGKSALEAIKEMNFDCLISDVVLPEIGGIQLAKETLNKNKNIKICLVSGYDLKSINDQLPQEITYVEKPFTLKKLKEVIDKLLNKT